MRTLRRYDTRDAATADKTTQTDKRTARKESGKTTTRVDAQTFSVRTMSANAKIKRKTKTRVACPLHQTVMFKNAQT